MMKQKLSALGIGMAIIAVIVFVTAITNFNDKTYKFTITDKDRITTSDNNGNTNSKYLIFGDDEYGNSLVFENTDNWPRMKFDSSNIQGALKVGETYEVTVNAYRIPFLSMYQNIISYKKSE